MITVKGYSEVGFEVLCGNIYDAFQRSKKTYMNLAQEMNVNSTQTAMNVIKNPQLVSDGTLTDAMRCVGVQGFIVIAEGLKFYYLKNGK